MKILLLNGHGINLKVDSASLHVKDGRFSTDEEPQEYIFLPKRIPYDTIVLYGQNGNISLEAIKWLNKHNIAIIILDWNGKLLTSMLPPESVQVKTKFNQYNTYQDESTRLKIAKKFIEAKFEKSKVLIEWVKERYGEFKFDIVKEEKKLKEVKV